MAKYSFELKKEVVMGCLNGGGSYKCLVERYGIASKTDVKKWIANYI
ncbi:transposase [Acetobacterium wieringae]|nr:transposase [Acetobacterium wieringae]